MHLVFASLRSQGVATNVCTRGIPQAPQGLVVDGQGAYSGVMPAALITCPHLVVSAVWNCANSWGVVVQASEPDMSKNEAAAGLPTAVRSS